MGSCPRCKSEYPAGVTRCPSDGSALQRTSVFDETTGELLREDATLGSYRLVRMLGEGGMGRVYLAEHTLIGRRVALKLLHPDYASNPKAVRRFFGEARAVNQIRHPNIVEITDFVEDGAEKYYIMEYLEGESLKASQLRSGILPLGRSIPIVIQVASALAAAHAASIVHRDVKPDNVFLIEKDGRRDFVKLLDFGVAKLPESQIPGSMQKTVAGAIIGTPEYMSPEQAAGTEVDHRSDIYSLGVILYELVTGRTPFTAKSFGEIVVKHMTSEATRPSRYKDLPQPVPAAIEAIILDCLQKDPSKRPQQMAEVGERLQVTLGVFVHPDAPVTPLAMARMPARRRVSRRKLAVPAAVAVIAAGVLAALAVGLVGHFARHQETRSAKADASTAMAGAADVQLSFTSEPQGAQVFRGDSPVPVGTTPFTLTTKRSHEAETFVFKLAGHPPARQAVVPAESTNISVTLTKAQKVGRRGRSGQTARSKQLDRGAVLDPFADE
jgi:tRNA A-37 threonylcarbamoyl transferase component Bud32